MTALDYGDVIYMHASSQSLHALDTVYHGALRFIKNSKLLFACIGWSAVSARRLRHWHDLINKALFGPFARKILVVTAFGPKKTLLSIPKVRTELGEKYAAPYGWNSLQNYLKIRNWVSVRVPFLKGVLNELMTKSSGCR